MSRSRDTGDILNRISGGVSGGQSYIGGTGSGESLTLASTSNATKGFIYLGAAQTSGFDGVNSRLGIGVAAPTTAIHALSTTEQLRLGFDASNFASFTVGSTGILTITSSGTVASTIIPNGLATSTTSTNGNLCVGSGSGSGFSAGAFGFTGSAGCAARVALKGATSNGVSTNYNYANLFVGSSPVSKTSSGIHDIFANAVIRPIGTITAGAATLNNTVSLYVEAATTGGAVGNYALWVDAGKVRFDEVLNLQTYTNSSPVDGDLWYDGTNLKFRQSSTTKTITWT